MKKHQNQEQKIKKFRKMHIWPSILFLIITIFGMIAGFCGLVSSYLLFQTSERCNNAYGSAVNTVNLLATASGNEEALLESFKKASFSSDAIFILDENGATIAGYGEATYDDKAWGRVPKELFSIFTAKLTDSDNYQFCVDTDPSTVNLFNEFANLDLTVILIPVNFDKFLHTDPELDECMFSARFWLKTELPNHNTVIIRERAPLYMSDFLKAFTFGLFSFGLMSLPILFFFVNIILSFLNQRRMTRLLYTDTVTMGKSYIYFEHNAAKTLHARHNAGKRFMIVDLTVMKYRNYCNYHGIHAGEILLEDVDASIRRQLQKKEFCAHSGKASFAIFLRCPDSSQGQARVQELVDRLAARYAHVGICIHAGIYDLPPQPASARKTLDPADCLSRASAARGSLTDENTSAVAVYDDKLLEEQLWTHKVEEKMQQALDREEFKVYIQPKYNPVTNQLAGGEALIRWINEEDGFISPGRFIPIFESNGFITKIDDYMISHVAKLQSEWLAAQKPVVPISVNVSRAHFANPDLAEHICELVDAYHVPHHLIEIELTESAFFDDKAALLKIVHQLQELGFEISMDDFGAGYSSLNSLKDLPLNVLKLDAEFFRGEDSENRREIVVSQAIQLAKSLNMRIVAEGVEEKDQVDFLAGQGCDMIQGFYFAKPMPAEEYEQKL